MELERFEELGRKIDALLEKVAQLARANEDLGGQLAEKQGEIQSLREKLTAMEEERSQVRTKVDDLLSRIEKEVG